MSSMRLVETLNNLQLIKYESFKFKFKWNIQGILNNLNAYELSK